MTVLTWGEKCEVRSVSLQEKGSVCSHSSYTLFCSLQFTYVETSNQSLEASLKFGDQLIDSMILQPSSRLSNSYFSCVSKSFVSVGFLSLVLVSIKYVYIKGLAFFYIMENFKLLYKTKKKFFFFLFEKSFVRAKLSLLYSFPLSSGTSETMPVECQFCLISVALKFMPIRILDI